jgi:hypothetical protein
MRQEGKENETNSAIHSYEKRKKERTQWAEKEKRKKKKEKRKKKQEDRWYVADVLIDFISYGGEAILYGVRALIKWWN